MHLASEDSPTSANQRNTDVSASALATGTNTAGQKYGSAANGDATLTLISAIGTNGEIGYVQKADLDKPVAATPSTAPKGKPAARTIPLYNNDGSTRIGAFTVNQ